MKSFLRISVFVTIACSLLCNSLKAQCSLDWAPGTGIPGIDGEAKTIVEWDPDGNGPQKPITVVGGDFSLAGSTSLTRIATWDGQSWAPLTLGLPAGIVSALANDDGVLWAALEPTPTEGAGEVYYPPAQVHKLVNGSWVKVLTLTRAGSWSPNSPATVYQILSTPSSLYIRGFFDSVVTENSVPNITFDTPTRLIRHTSAGWEPVETIGDVNPHQLHWVEPDVLIYRASNSFYALTPSAHYRIPPSDPYWITPGTSFVWKGKLSYLTIERIEGEPYYYHLYSLEEPYNSSTNSFVRTKLPIRYYDSVSGTNSLSTRDDLYLYKPDWCVAWNGTDQRLVSGFRGEISAIAATSQGIVVASDSKNIGSGGHRIASFDSRSLAWSAMGEGFNGPVRAVAVANGDLYVAGEFTRAGSVSAMGIARRRNGVWEALGSGLTGSVEKLIELDGEILACGRNLESAGGVTNTRNFARWTGSEWKPAPNLNGIFYLDAARYRDHILIACQNSLGYTFVYKYKWSEYSNVSQSFGSDVLVTRILPTNDGQQLMAAPGRYNGFNSYTLLQYDGAKLELTNLRGYWPWTIDDLHSDTRNIFNLSDMTYWSGGSVWQSPLVVPQGVWDVCEFGGGGVFVGSWDNFGGTSKLLFRDQAGNTSSLASPPNGTIMSCTNVNGKLAVGGDFTRAGSKTSAYFAMLEPQDISIQITSQPKDTQGCWSRVSQFSVGANSSKPLKFQWRRSGVAMTNGVTANGSQIYGCTTSNLRIAPAANGKLTHFDAAVYDCVITTACSTEVTHGARLSLAGSDFNCNNVVDDYDFAVFSLAYDRMLCSASGMPVGCPADLNADGIVDDADFSLFLVQYDQFLAS